MTYKLQLQSYSQTNDFEIKNCLFRAVQLTENTDPDNYARYGIGFEDCSSFSLSHGRWFGKNVIIVRQYTSIII